MLKKIYCHLLKCYKAPTPERWRKIGDSLLIVGGSLTAYMIDRDDHRLAVLALTCTILGKIITNLATEDNSKAV